MIAPSAISVRAMRKPFDEFPDWMMCCESAKDYLAKNTLPEMEVDPRFDIAEATCRFCGKVNTGKQYARIVKIDTVLPGMFIALDCLELDEGPTT